MAQDDAPTMRENGVPLTLGFGDIKTETNNLKDNYTDIAEVIAIHRLSAVRSTLGVRWSHFILNPFGILVLLPYYKS